MRNKCEEAGRDWAFSKTLHDKEAGWQTEAPYFVTDLIGAFQLGARWLLEQAKAKAWELNIKDKRSRSVYIEDLETLVGKDE